MSALDEKLETVRHQVGAKPHIKVDVDACPKSELRKALYFCPAGCFKEEDGEIVFHYEGCFECGTCRIMLPEKAVDWDYPDDGCGVTFRLG